jgi:hypothetical protein
MLGLASIADTATTCVGLMAGLIAVGGFIAHVRPALSGADEARLRLVTVRGGIGGLALAISVVVLSAFID